MLAARDVRQQPDELSASATFRREIDFVKRQCVAAVLWPPATGHVVSMSNTDAGVLKLVHEDGTVREYDSRLVPEPVMNLV